MKIAGIVWKDKKDNLWLCEVPLLDLATQAQTKEEIAEMAKDAVESLVNDKNFSVTVFLQKDSLYLEANDQKKLISLILKRQRKKNKLTLEEVAAHLHAKSINEYAQYEKGDHQPSFEKFERLLQAIDPNIQPVISCLPINPTIK
ncbi:MAG: helix-turn-helix transcriptional regulator [bacterium]